MKNRAYLCIIFFVLVSCVNQESIRRQNQYNDFSPGRFVYPINNSEYLGNNGFQRFSSDYLPSMLPSGLIVTTDWEQSQSVVLCDIVRVVMPSGVRFFPQYDPLSDSTKWIHDDPSIHGIRVELLFYNKDAYLSGNVAAPWRSLSIDIPEDHLQYPDLLYFTKEEAYE